MNANSLDSVCPLGLVQPRRSLSRTLFTALVSLVVVLTGTRLATAANSPPTNISINFAPLTGDPGITIGTFVVTDPDAGQTHSCALVAGPGDTNNASFQIINGTTLKLQPAISLELKNYFIRVRATDNGAPAESTEFTVTILLAPVPPAFSLLSGLTWTPRTSAGHRTWFALASSADGLKLVAAEASGHLFTSGDGGKTWTQRAAGGTGIRTWGSLASSADGLKLVAGEQSGGIYTSIDGGANWVQRTTGLPPAAGSAWYGLASSADGVKLVAANNGGSLYTSIDSGASWTVRTSGLPAGSPAWQSAASSTNGQFLAAVASGDRIYPSTDAGATWVARDSERDWSSVASSADGQRLVAVVNKSDGQIYTSTNAGTNWTARTADTQPRWGVASSADGWRLAAIPRNGLPDISMDAGNSFEVASDGLPVNPQWAAIASSADGRRAGRGGRWRSVVHLRAGLPPAHPAGRSAGCQLRFRLRSHGREPRVPDHHGQ